MIPPDVKALQLKVQRLQTRNNRLSLEVYRANRENERLQRLLDEARRASRTAEKSEPGTDIVELGRQMDQAIAALTRRPPGGTS